MPNDQTIRDRYERRKSALKQEQSSFVSHWKELAQFVKPRRGRFFIDDRNKGGDRYNSIINSKATQAHSVARSGMFAGSCNPTTPWFKWQSSDPDLDDYQPVKQYYYQSARVLYAIFSQSNFYPSTATLLGELILFATGAMIDVDDYEDVARFYPLTIGSYLVGQDERQVVNTIIREYEMTTLQIMEKFGKSGGKISTQVQNAYDIGNYDAWWPVTHIIEPNLDYSESKRLAKYKRFKSCYYEQGNADKNAFLSESGFDSFPAYVPRWDVTAEDVWGTDCPGMVALGDIKGLQIEERRKAQAIDKMVNPPLSGPASVRNVPIDSLPGGVTLYDDGGGNSKLGPLYSVNPQLQEMRLDITAVEERIDKAFYVHLFRAISDMQGVQPRNQLELNKRDQERLLELGPVLEHLHGEFLAKVVDRTFEKAARHGILPPAPPELQGRNLQPKFIGPLAMAQQASAVGSIERTSTYVAGLVSAGFTDAGKKFKAAKSVERYADIVGTPPDLIASDEELAAAQEAEQKALAAQQGTATMEQMAGAVQKGAGAAKALAETPTGGNSVLQKISEAVAQRGNPNLFTGGR